MMDMTIRNLTAFPMSFNNSGELLTDSPSAVAGDGFPCLWHTRRSGEMKRIARLRLAGSYRNSLKKNYSNQMESILSYFNVDRGGFEPPTSTSLGIRLPR